MRFWFGNDQETSPFDLWYKERVLFVGWFWCILPVLLFIGIHFLAKVW